MITRDWLLRREPTCDPVPQATAWAVAGWYPTTCCSTYERGHYWITIEDFVDREATVAP